MQDIKKQCLNTTADINTGIADKILINVKDENPRQIEIINMGKGFCIMVHYENKVPCTMDTRSRGITTYEDGSFQGMALTMRSRTYHGFLEFYNKVKGGIR